MESNSEPQKPMSRRGFLRFGGGAAAGAAVALAVPEIGKRNEQQERQEFYDTIKFITYEDLNDPESEKLSQFKTKCALEYARVTDLEVDTSDLASRTKMYGTESEFYDGIRKSEPTFVPEENERIFGRVSLNDNTVRINLALIRDDNTRLETDYPGVMLFKQLCHEWGDVLSVDNRDGEQLGQDNNTFGDQEGNNPQVWERYRGGKVYTKDYQALYLFGNAWNELATRRVVMQSMKHDEALLSAATTLSNDSLYREATDKFSRVVEHMGMDVREMARLYTNSNVELMFQRMGSVFDDSALETLPQFIIKSRNEDEVINDRDFLIGRRAASIINNEDWKSYRELLDHMKPRE